MRRPPHSEQALLADVRALVGSSIAAVAAAEGVTVPRSKRHAKGFVGTLLEQALGADAGTRPEPDFRMLGIELKTIPITVDGHPRESTYVCVAPKGGVPWGPFDDSLLSRKLACVLFVPIIGSAEHTLGESVISEPVLWKPDSQTRARFAADWQLLAEHALSGAAPDGRLGELIQLRPKAAHSLDFRPGIDAEGEPTRTIPMGFYLRTRFTRRLFELERTHEQ